MLEINTGSDTDDALRRQLFELSLLSAGCGAGKLIPLYGASEERADAREEALNYARMIGVPAVCQGGCRVLIGWQTPRPRTFRGYRYMRHEHAQFWLHWRKAKKFIRKVSHG